MRLALSHLVLIAFCNCQAGSAVAQTPAQQEGKSAPRIADLRAERWRTTSLVNTSAGAVQHGGDDLFGEGGVVGYLAARLKPHLPADADVQLKTADIRLFIPGKRIDSVQLSTAQAIVPGGAMVAGPIASLISGFSKDKSASAIFCLSVAGKDYLGNDARLFRMGPDAELKESIAAAAEVLAKNVAAGAATDSPACSPGWEGGQQRAE